MSDWSQSPSLCGKLPFECLYDLSRWTFLSNVQGNSINGAIEVNGDSIDILRVKCGCPKLENAL